MKTEGCVGVQKGWVAEGTGVICMYGAKAFSPGVCDPAWHGHRSQVTGQEVLRGNAA